MWSGLIRGYYLGRWSGYAKALETGKEFGVAEWESTWINKAGSLTKAPTTGDVYKYAIAMYKATSEYITENLSMVSISDKYTGNNKVQLSMFPKQEGLTVYYSTDGSSPESSSTTYTKPIEVSLPATVKAVAYQNTKQIGDINTMNIPVSFGKSVSVNPNPSEKYAASLGMTLTDGELAADRFNDGKWLGFEGDNFNTVINLEGKFKIKKVSFSYLENGYNAIFTPHAVAVETSADGITYQSAGIYEFDDNKWSMAPKKNLRTITFPETVASHVRLLFYSRGECPESLPCKGKKAWVFVDEITVE